MEKQEERPAYVRFERKPKEDRNATVMAGKYVAKDVDYVLITPAGSKDEIIREVGEWLTQIKQQAKEGRMNPQWEAAYARAYEFWKSGQEIPLEGTPILGWPLLSPAQQSNLIAGANIRTVEDLAIANAEACSRMGMGAQELKQKAQAWLKAAKDIGSLASENAALRLQVATLTARNEELEKRNVALSRQLETAAPAVVSAVKAEAKPADVAIV